MCVSDCLCVTEVGCSWGETRVVKRDLCTSICWTSNSTTNVRRAGFIQNSWQGAEVEADAIGELQLNRTQSGSSSWNGCNLGPAAEVDANWEQQLKRIDAIVWAEADAVGEQQLYMYTESCPAPEEGSSWASKASKLSYSLLMHAPNIPLYRNRNKHCSLVSYSLCVTVQYVSSAHHVSSAHPPLQVKVTAQVSKQCSKGPPITKV